MALSDNLRSRRIALGMSQREIADQVGISQQLMQKFEINTRKPNPETLVRLARILGTTCEKLVLGEDAAQ